MEPNHQFRYYAFVSYRGADVKWAKWFVKKSDNYLLPTITPEELKRGNHPPVKLKEDDKYLYPVFRDRDNLMSGKLLQQILEAIDVSRKIVVLCTPTAAQQGSWMDDELQHIIASGRISQLTPLVVKGRIYTIEDYEAAGRPIEQPFEDESNPYVLRRYMQEHREHAAAINYIEFEEQGVRSPDRAFIKCVSSIIEVPFESLWDRFGREQKRKRRIRRFAVATAIAATVLAGVATWIYNQAVNVHIGLQETSVVNHQLPPLHNAIVRLTIDKEAKTDTITSLCHAAIFANIPRAAIGQEAHITVTCQDWLTTDTTLILTRDLNVSIARDPRPYGDIQFLIWDPAREQAVPGIHASVAGIEGISDSEGRVRLTIPLEKQQAAYTVECEMPLEDNTLNAFPTLSSTALLIQSRR